jgi:hypothetical protein
MRVKNHTVYVKFLTHLVETRCFASPLRQCVKMTSALSASIHACFYTARNLILCIAR